MPPVWDAKLGETFLQTVVFFLVFRYNRREETERKDFMAADLSQTRQRIDEINQKLLALFEERQKLVRLVAEYKKENGLSHFRRQKRTGDPGMGRENGRPRAFSVYEGFFLKRLWGSQEVSADPVVGIRKHAI